ncbi:MAG: SCO family protein [Deltaproteobacteria bacterium]|nr:MAG: SCO family protein [Deltaproteobacteria bacterium]
MTAGRARTLLIALNAVLAIALVILLVLPAGDEDDVLPGAVIGDTMDFTLQSTAGPVRLSSLRGNVVLVYFGYTACPDVCPTSLAAITAGLERLTAEERARVKVIFISVDPARDTPTRVAEYASFFAPEVMGVTGTTKQLKEVADHFGVFYKRRDLPGSAGGYAMDHTALTYLVAPSGKLAARLDHGAPADTIAGAIRRALAPEKEVL